MICNVCKVEEKDEITKNLNTRNPYLSTIEEVESKIEVLFSKPAAGDTLQYILKCEPAVRALIHKNDDRVCLRWGVYDFRDRYYPMVCYYCQRYGHHSNNCKAKTSGENTVCYKCSGSHEGKNCRNTIKKCINCVRNKKPEPNNHYANDYKCPVYEAEVIRVKNMTDHGW